MNSIRENNISFLLNKYKDIVKNDDGSFRLAHRCISGDNDSYVKFVDTGYTIIMNLNIIVINASIVKQVIHLIFVY